MNCLRHSLCYTLVVLYVMVSTPVFGQEPPDSSPSSPNQQQTGLTLHPVDFQTKMEWGAQWLFYPESLDSVRTLHAYRGDVCSNVDQTTSNNSTENLGFVLEAPSTEEGVTGELIDGNVRNTETVTLDSACQSFRSNDNLPNDGSGGFFFLSRYPIPNQEQNHIGLFWTDVSNIDRSANVD